MEWMVSKNQALKRGGGEKENKRAIDQEKEEMQRITKALELRIGGEAGTQDKFKVKLTQILLRLVTNHEMTTTRKSSSCNGKS